MLLQDPPKLATTRRPSWRIAFAVLAFVRILSALWMIVGDCDEVYNYWEPLHLLAMHKSTDEDTAFETWEYAPQYAIRSWAYIALHAVIPRVVSYLPGPTYLGFYALRVTLALISAACDTVLYEQVARYVHVRVARYMLVFLAGCAGMLGASIAFLPSSFVMYTTSVAAGMAMRPASMLSSQRTIVATLAFALGALAGWPFALLLSLPFVWEELLCRGEDATLALFRRCSRWVGAVLLAILTLAMPILLVDSLAYGRLALASVNTIVYNVLSRSRGVGPELYGVEPPSYYAMSMLLHMNVVFPLGLIALPLVGLAAWRMPSRVAQPASCHGTSHAYLLALRVLPVYLWLGVLGMQAHKEERFMYPMYPLLCFNAALSLYLLRAMLEQMYMHITHSPYRASRTILFSSCTLVPLLAACILGAMRSMALVQHYHAPLSLGHILSSLPESHTVCYGKEWHRFPSHFFVPPSMRVEFIPSAFDGILPHHFTRGSDRWPARAPWEQTLTQHLAPLTWMWPWASYTRQVPHHVNDRNEMELDRYVPLSTCTLLVDVDRPWREVDKREPRYRDQTDEWAPLACRSFLDAEASRTAASHLPRWQRWQAMLAP
ncbi:glycosyltransferase family 22 protein [Malassezia pachydermatis]|uniref:Mannosyltransferase n=1 Tax=Malassezia pachydermatis TaxID=77020 RepID=A0A0M8MSI4_9BASI|nr:glycosyltransferase family 22 protein [Malassezia pachydermatis]KOS15887.1 glycosyltransferase family 22 protein [Malassezia pachydermatis]